MHKALMTAAGLALAGVFLGLSMPAEAAKHRGGNTFERIDKNGDGALQTKEIERLSKRKFKRLDADKNGYLTVDELVDGKRARRAKKGRAVTDRHLKKFEKRAKRHVKRRDRNGDGKVSRAEFIA